MEDCFLYLYVFENEMAIKRIKTSNKNVKRGEIKAKIGRI